MSCAGIRNLNAGAQYYGKLPEYLDVLLISIEIKYQEE